MREILEKARRSSSQTPPSILNVIAIDIYIGLCFPGREKLKESLDAYRKREEEEKGEREKCFKRLHEERDRFRVYNL